MDHIAPRGVPPLSRSLLQKKKSNNSGFKCKMTQNDNGKIFKINIIQLPVLKLPTIALLSCTSFLHIFIPQKCALHNQHSFVFNRMR